MQKFGFRKVGKVLVACVLAMFVAVSNTVNAEEVSLVSQSTDSALKQEAEVTEEGTKEGILLDKDQKTVPAAIQEVAFKESSELESEIVVQEETLLDLKVEEEGLLKEIAAKEMAIGELEKEILATEDEVNVLQLEAENLSEEITELENTVPDMVSHRGNSGDNVAPEGSLLAYQKAVEDGFTHLEGDVQMTADGVAVMHHDETINRIARNVDGTVISEVVKISENTFDYLSQFDYGLYLGEEFRGTKLLTFDEFVSFSKESGVDIHVELKQDFDLEQKKALYKIAQKHDMEEKIGWATFYWEEFEDFNSFAPEAQLEVLAGTFRPNLMETLQSLNNGQRKVIASVGHGVHPLNVQKIIDAGFDVYVWTVNSTDALSRYEGMDVKAFITDGSSKLVDSLKVKGELESKRLEYQTLLLKKQSLETLLKDLEVSKLFGLAELDQFKLCLNQLQEDILGQEVLISDLKGVGNGFYATNSVFSVLTAEDELKQEKGIKSFDTKSETLKIEPEAPKVVNQATVATLPNTGDTATLGLSFAGIGLLLLSVFAQFGFVKKRN